MTANRRQRTYYPAIRLWRAELAAHVGGQDPYDPTTWVWDGLFHAMLHELEAFNLRGMGALEEALGEIQRARASVAREIAAVSTNGTAPELWDGRYRDALHARAASRLGAETANALVLKGRPTKSGNTHRGRRSAE